MMAAAKDFFYRVMFWLVLPVSAIQGLRLRKTALRLPEAQGDKNGICGNGNLLQLLAFGDSIIAGVGTVTTDRSLPVQLAAALAEDLHCQVRWLVHGQNGADIRQLQQTIQTLEGKQHADLILISIGVNDVTGLTSETQWSSRLKSLTNLIRITWPTAKVIFIGLPPMGKFPLPPQPLRFTLGHRAKTLDNIATAHIAKQINMFHIPTRINPAQQEFCEDGFHPSARATRAWAKQLAQQLKNDNLHL